MQFLLRIALVALTACGAHQHRPGEDGMIRADAVQSCHRDDGQGRPDHAYVASYRCADGSMPLGGELARAADARVGSLGTSTDGHILDQYEIPCAGGAVRIAIDAYHCADQQGELDPGNLRRDELARMAQTIRNLHSDTSTEDAMSLRSELFVWVLNTQQFTVLVCRGLVPLLPDSENETPYIAELTLSLAASVIEDGGDPADPVRSNIAAIEGLLTYYDAILQTRGEGAHDPQLDALREMVREGSLEARVREGVSHCDLRAMGVHRYRE